MIDVLPTIEDASSAREEFCPRARRIELAGATTAARKRTFQVEVMS
jgi:hypothetical protein